jgi:hypothetical protein
MIGKSNCHKRKAFLILCFTTAAVLMGFTVTTTPAQSDAAGSNKSSAVIIIASAWAERVRFSAPSSVMQIRLEVYDSSGRKLVDNEVRGGNVLDWHLQDGQAERLRDDTYLCVVTVKSLSGRIAERIGTVTVEKGFASVQAVDASHLTRQQSDAVGPLGEDAPLMVPKEEERPTTTVLAHNGEEGQITRGKGALSFRIGDFFSGKDTEQMRLNEEGNLGIGITHPQARLDVDGFISTSKGIVFPDGTIQTTAAIVGSGSDSTKNGKPKVNLPNQANFTNQSETAGKGAKGKVSPEFNVNEDLTVNGSIFFTTGSPRDIAMLNNSGGIRIYSAPTLTNSPASAAIQFFGNGSAFTGQAYIDSGAHDNAAVIFRTAPTGGTIAERMRITSTGDVGIGTSGPASKLDVSGAINTSTQYNIGGSRVLSAAGANNLFAGVNAGAANTTGDRNAFFGAAAGVNNTEGFSNSFFGSFAGNANTTGGLNSFFGSFAGNANTTGGLNSFFGNIAGAVNTTGGGNSFFGFRAGGSNTVGDGNTFVGYNSGLSNTTENNNTLLGFQANGVAGITNATAIGANAIVSQSNSLVLGSNANVGIGSSAPAAPLHILGPALTPPIGLASTENGLLLGLESTSGYKWIQSYGGSLAINPVGNSVGIGTSAPAFPLDVAGAAHASSFPTSSDARLKTNISQLTEVLEKIEKIRGVSFDWNEVYESLGRSTGHREIGVVAQEVEAVFPELVTTWGEQGYRAVDYGRLSAALVEAVKELRAEKDAQLEWLKSQNVVSLEQIRQQREQIAQQQGQIDSLRRIVCMAHLNDDICRGARTAGRRFSVKHGPWQRHDSGARIRSTTSFKRRNNEQNPATTLIAKKSGKKIASGETVSSDGTLSNQFSFTR